jgi:predicted dinucleotide-binding enzyme
LIKVKSYFGGHIMFRFGLAVLLSAVVISPATVLSQDRETVAVIGTGDMGNSLGPKLAASGYSVIYGSRDPLKATVQELLEKTGSHSTATTQREAAQAADIVLLAVPWPPMEQVAQNLGNLDGKIVVDVSFPIRQAEDGYPESRVATSSAELIQEWNPEARVVKWSLPTAYYIDNPSELGAHGPTNLIAADDRHAKEVVAKMSYAIGQDPIDAGPLRMSREIEGLVRLFMVPIYQRRGLSWEVMLRRTDFWPCVWQDDWSELVPDSNNLSEFPTREPSPGPCNDYKNPWQ